MLFSGRRCRGRGPPFIIILDFFILYNEPLFISVNLIPIFLWNFNKYKFILFSFVSFQYDIVFILIILGLVFCPFSFGRRSIHIYGIALLYKESSSSKDGCYKGRPACGRGISWLSYCLLGSGLQFVGKWVTI